MNSSEKKDFLRNAFFVWIALVVLVCVTNHRTLVPSVSLGILVAMLNLNSLFATIEKKEKVDSKKSARITGTFFLRYIFVAAIFAILVQAGEQLVGFLIGFLSLYAVFFADYIRRLGVQK